MAFEIKNNVLLSYTEEKDVKNVVIPEGVTGLGGWVGDSEYYYAFYKCKYIESITIPASVTVLNPEQFYYIKNLRWIECKGEVETTDIAFPGCKNLVYLICNPNTPLSKMPKKWKQMLAIGVTKYLYDGNTVSAEALKEVKSYFTSQNKKQELYKLGYAYPFVLQFMIDEGLLSEELYDEMIGQAQANQNAEVLTMLIEGKSKQYPSEDLWERAEKKIDKEIAYAQKMDDHTSVEYLKSQWSWKKLEDGTLVIWTYKGTDSEVFIPATVGKNKVTAVRGFLFHSNSFDRNEWLRNNIKKIHIAEGIMEIGSLQDGPMSDFAIATHVYLPKSVKRICEDAFTPKRKVTIHAAAGSYAESFAKENNIKFVAEKE